MKYLIILMGVVCLALPACTPAPEPEPETSPEPIFNEAEEEAAVREVFENFKTAYNNHDVKALPPFFLNETIIQWRNVTKGGAEIEKLYTGIFERNKDILFELQEDFGFVFLTPDVAIWRGVGEYTGGYDADGEPRPPWQSRGALVMVKKEGQWQWAALFERSTEE